MSIAGAIVGCVTGFISGIIQIPYASYLVYKKMREDGFLWDSALLTAIALAVFNLFTYISWIGYGFYEGRDNGIVAAFKLPFTFFNKMEEYLIWGCTGDDFRFKGIGSLFQGDGFERIRSFFQGDGFGFERIRSLFQGDRFGFKPIQSLFQIIFFPDWITKAPEIEKKSSEHKFNLYKLSKLRQKREQLSASGQVIPEQINADINLHYNECLKLEFRINFLELCIRELMIEQTITRNGTVILSVEFASRMMGLIRRNIQICNLLNAEQLAVLRNRLGVAPQEPAENAEFDIPPDHGDRKVSEEEKLQGVIQLVNNTKICEAISSLPISNACPALTLTAGENTLDLNEYKRAIDADNDPKTKQENKVLYDYLTSVCPFERDLPHELKLEQDEKGVPIPPITIVQYEKEGDEMPSYIRTSNFNQYIEYLNAERYKSKPILIPDKQVPLEEAGYFRGYFPVDVAAILKYIKEKLLSKQMVVGEGVNAHATAASSVESPKVPHHANWATQFAKSVAIAPLSAVPRSSYGNRFR